MTAPHRAEKNLVRVLVAIALGVALLASVLMPVPLGEDGRPALPAVAFGQAALYRMETSLLVFYSCLLLITPAFSGLARGRLPTEISAKGARFAEETDQSAKLTEAKINGLKRTADALAEGLATAHAEIEQLRERAMEDSTQPKVDSKP